MHVAKMLKPSQFTVNIEGMPASVGDVFPDWDESDRVAIVLDAAYGALDASLLIQLAALQFFSVRPERGTSAPQYPQTYLFHVGGPHGDFSGFDIWPARHEVFLPADDPYALLGAINDRAITRLVLPDATPGGLEYIDAAPSGWSDASYARDHLRSALLYRVQDGADSTDVTVSSSDPELRFMSKVALDVEGTKVYFDSLSDQQLVDMEVGPSTAEDIRVWSDMFVARGGEVSRADRDALLTQIADGPWTQTFRRIDVDRALSVISGICK
ncbi:MAG TPA: hypothetical protein VNT53_07250 [Pseudolysinimonas sp.]|nr:hypothetical protein [Pseudolysinimonas sp.]